ncbi:hypothetical protein QOZ80_6BG0461100 [Eleusine coracana subsp. coracana]|nr:hypothetical protein QOZ80_6BG0461100 [Eleusine coracana subsp. coracana]
MQPPAAAAAATAARARRLRVDAATALFFIASAAAALALFAMTMDPANSGFLGPCAPTDEELADLRVKSELLLLAAAAQLLGATTARFSPQWPFTIFASVLAVPTAYRVVAVLRMVVGCHGHVSGALAEHYWEVIGVLDLAILVAIVTAVAGSLM